MKIFKTLRKRGLALFLVLTMCFSMIQTTAFAAETTPSFAGGSGTEEDPYQISNRSQLENLKHYLGPTHNKKFFELTADIDLGNEPWEPIGTGSAYEAFQGTLIGGGHTISNLNVSNTKYAGLFGYIASANICNMTITNANVTGYSTGSAGAFVGTASGNAKLCNLHVMDSTISTGTRGVEAGGIVGEIASSSGWTTTVCCSSVETGVIVSATGTGYGTGAHAGGIVGDFSGSGGTVNIRRSYCAATSVTSTNGCAGGILGSSVQRVDSTGPRFHISDCYNTAAVSITSSPVNGKQNAAGGIIGLAKNAYSDIKNCYNSGEIKTQNGTNASYAAGIGAYDIGLSYTACVNIGKVTTNNTNTGKKPTLGTISGYSGKTTNCYYLEGCLDPDVKPTYYTSKKNGNSTSTAADMPVLKPCVDGNGDTCTCEPNCECHCRPVQVPTPSETTYTLIYDRNYTIEGSEDTVYKRITQTSTEDSVTFGVGKELDETGQWVDFDAPTRSGFIFAGWSDTSDGDVKYESGEDEDKNTITVSQDSTSKTVYAVWTAVPSLTVTKAVDNSAPKPGESIVYTITVTNTGAGDASDVTVTDVLPTELTFVSWKLNDGEENKTKPEDGKYTIGTVDKETGTATLTITAKVGDTVAAGTTIKNTATADYTNKPEDADPKGEVTVTVAQPKLTGITKELVSVTVNETVTDMTVEGATLPTVEKGDTVTLRYKITITGSVGAEYEVTDDAVLETDSSLNDELKTGTAEIFVTKSVDTSTVGTKSVTNTAYVKPGEGTDPIQENEPTGHPSNEVNTNIVVTDPDANKYSVIYSWGKIGVTPVSYVLPEGTELPGTKKYAVGATVPVDISITKDVKAMVGEDTYIFNGWKTTDAEVKNGGFTMPAKDVALSADWVKVSYSIGVTKKITAVTHEGVTTQINEGDPVRVDHDDKVTYEVTVTNTSNQTLYALRLDDVMDPGLTLITGTDHADVEKNGDNTSTVKYLGTTVVKDPAELDVEGQTPYYWELPGSFAVGAKVTLTYQAKINMDAEHIIKNANENVQLNNTIYASAFQTPQPESEPEPADTLAVEELSYSIVSFRGDVSGSASAGAGSAGASASGTMSYPVTYSWGKVGDTEVTETTAGLPATVRHHKGDVVDVDTTAKTATTTIGEDENQKTYKFGGWTTSDATVTDGKFSMPGQKVVLTARWVEVIVTFDPNGGSWAEDETPKRVEADADGKVTAPAAPTNGDKEFEGWFTEGGEKVDPATKIFTEDTTLYAHWKVKEDKPTTYTVTVYYVYSTGGPASDPVTKTLEKGEEYSIPSPSITGYKPSEGTVSGIMEDKDVVRTVVYTPEDTSRPTHTVTVHYVYEGGTRALPDAIVTVEEGKDYSIPSPAINGYNVDRPVVSGTMRDVNVEVTVTYSRINIPTPPTPTYFTVTWLDELAPGETVKTQRVTSLREAVYPAHPFHPGYEGNGWSEPVRDASGNYTITAQYVQLRVDPQVPSYEYLRDVLKVTVEVVCDTHATHEPMVYNVPLKEDSYGGAVIGDRCVITIAPEAYVAEYIGDHSTVDVAPQTIELVYVASAAEPVALFEKASEPASEEIPAVEVEIPEEEETVISEESPVPVEDSVGDAAETGTEETTDEETIELSVTSEATIEGHWEIADGSAALVIFHVRCEVPEPETYTVTWLDDNGALLDRQTAEIGQPEPTYAGVAPSKPGYTFAGWSDPEVDDDGNIIYVAQYEPVAPAETYMVTWLDDNGALLDRQTVEIGQPEPAYGGTAPSKPGYTFTGWSDPEVDDDGNIIYVAQYEPVAPAGTYTVTWLDDNGTLLDRQTVENGQPEPAYGGTAPSKSGYTFTGWSEPVTDGAGNVTYVAQYEPVPETPSETHTVTWVDWNGTRLQQAVVNNGAAEPSYTGTTPVRSSDGVYYYTFAGWSAPAVDADGNVTYTAQYTPTLVYNPGTPSYPSYPSNPSTPGNPSTPSNPTPPTTDIPDTNPPLTDNPSGDGTTITDQDVPLAGAVGLNDVDHFAYIIGYSDDTVRPLNNITRAEVATIFFRLMTDEYRTSNWATTNDFSDVAAENWFNNAISTCANAGALNGYSNGSFRPNANITRAEFAAIAARFLDKEQYTDDGTGDFSDTADHWAAKEIRLAAKAGWIQGSGNKFRPNDYITRAEVMTIVNRMLDRVPDKDHMLDTMKKWTDNPEDAWYYEAVQEATNEHAYERDELGVVETWTEILTVRDWKTLEAEWASTNAR